MTDLFKQIIMGEKDIKEIDKEATKSEKSKRNIEVAKVFLKKASKFYTDKKLAKRDIKKAISIYEDLLKENKTIKSVINSKADTTIKDVEHIIKIFLEDFVKSQSEGSIWTRPLPIGGFIEPLILSLITLMAGIAFLGQLYLKLF